MRGNVPVVAPVLSSPVLSSVVVFAGVAAGGTYALGGSVGSPGSMGSTGSVGTPGSVGSPGTFARPGRRCSRCAAQRGRTDVGSRPDHRGADGDGAGTTQQRAPRAARRSRFAALHSLAAQLASLRRPARCPAHRACSRHLAAPCRPAPCARVPPSRSSPIAPWPRAHTVAAGPDAAAGRSSRRRRRDEQLVVFDPVDDRAGPMVERMGCEHTVAAEVRSLPCPCGITQRAFDQHA